MIERLYEFGVVTGHYNIYSSIFIAHMQFQAKNDIIFQMFWASIRFYLIFLLRSFLCYENRLSWYGSWASWSPSQLSLGERCDPLWTGVLLLTITVWIATVLVVVVMLQYVIKSTNSWHNVWCKVSITTDQYIHRYFDESNESQVIYV